MKHLGSSLLLFAGLVYSFQSFADYRTAVHVEKDGWNVELYELKSGELQDHVGHWVFSAESDARSKENDLRESIALEISDNSVLLLPPESREGFLWKVDNQWSWEWELKYAAWIKDNVDTHFFEKYNKLIVQIPPMHFVGFLRA